MEIKPNARYSFDERHRAALPQNWQSGYTAMVGTEYRWLRLASLPDWDVALRRRLHESANASSRSNLQSGFHQPIPTFPPSALGSVMSMVFLGLIRCGESRASVHSSQSCSPLTCHTRPRSMKFVPSRAIRIRPSTVATLIHAGSLSCDSTTEPISHFSTRHATRRPDVQARKGTVIASLTSR